ncbi:MAG TPA: phospholipase D family protein [Ktedonobacteraceae bacterium]|nr:phospholipase D family protein [Ktedonobacteraceae bacterium]
MLEEQDSGNWWAEGDTPVHTDSRVTYLVDGRTAMLAMCRHFLAARKYIYLANWGMTPGIELVRGVDHRAGPDGSPEQEALIEELRAEGLEETAIELWRTHALSLETVLGYAVSKGVEVKVLLWDSPEFFSHYQPQEAREQLTKVGVTCLLDDSARGLVHHPVESLHQKISIVDGTHAFVGGVDPLIERAGEFDRWDTYAHFFSTPLRRTHEQTSPHPWHDAHSMIEGPAAGDVELNFRQRWNDVVQRHQLDKSLLVPEHPLAPPLQSKTVVQIARTIPQHTYNFTPTGGIQGIAQLYAHAFGNIQRFVYIENQYFWLRAYTGLDVALVGFDNPDMERNIQELAEALRRGAAMSIILPDHPNVGRAFSDAALTLLREKAPAALTEGRIQAFCLATSEVQETGTHYRPIYVHAKVAIVDDLWATVGSGNLNNRGMRDDTELNVAVLDPILAHGLRLMLQAEHLGWANDEDLFQLSRLLGRQQQTPEQQKHAAVVLKHLHEQLNDPLVAMQRMHERAWDNLRLYKEKQPLIGHLLPYLTAEEAQYQGLPFREEHGWIEEP